MHLRCFVHIIITGHTYRSIIGLFYKIWIRFFVMCGAVCGQTNITQTGNHHSSTV